MAKIKELKNKKMNDATYSLKKEALKYVYEAKKIDPTLPRITVRVTENNGKILGMAKYGSNTIWIVEKSIIEENYDLRTIVFHEILHAVYFIRHDEDCPLMKAIHTPLTKKECEKYFKKWINKSKNFNTKTQAAA